MAKEKVFRSGKKSRKKKKKKKEAEGMGWVEWLTTPRPPRRGQQKRKNYQQHQEQNANQSDVSSTSSKKKSKVTSEDKYNTWNRAQVTGLTRSKLYLEIDITETEDCLLTEIKLEVDHGAAAVAKKKKHNENLLTILTKITQ